MATKSSLFFTVDVLRLRANIGQYFIDYYFQIYKTDKLDIFGTECAREFGLVPIVITFWALSNEKKLTF